MGICGQAEGLPQLPDGQYQPPMGLTQTEQWVRLRMKQKLGWTLTPGRLANLTRPLHGRAPCHYCGTCGRGCITHSYFNSYFTTVADALHTGRCTHIPNAMVHRVLMNAASGRAEGVLYVDRDTRELHRVSGRAVHPLRAGAGIGAHPVQFGHDATSERTGQPQRRAGTLPDGPRRGRRRRERRVPPVFRQPQPERAQPAWRHLYSALPEP